MRKIEFALKRSKRTMTTLTGRHYSFTPSFLPMRKLKCTDIDPTSDCHYEATGATASEVADNMLVHAKEAHADKLAQMNMSDADMKTMFESKVHE